MSQHASVVFQQWAFPTSQVGVRRVIKWAPRDLPTSRAWRKRSCAWGWHRPSLRLLATWRRPKEFELSFCVFNTIVNCSAAQNVMRITLGLNSSCLLRITFVFVPCWPWRRVLCQHSVFRIDRFVLAFILRLLSHPPTPCA